MNIQKLIFSTLVLASLNASANSIYNRNNSILSTTNISGNPTLSPDKEPLVLSIRQSRLHLEVSEDYNSGTITMFDILGNKIFEVAANEHFEYSLVSIKTGLYFIVLKGPKGNYTRKFLHKQEG